jgi:hypothetical protein
VWSHDSASFWNVNAIRSCAGLTYEATRGGRCIGRGAGFLEGHSGVTETGVLTDLADPTEEATEITVPEETSVEDGATVSHPTGIQDTGLPQKLEWRTQESPLTLILLL